MSDGPRDEAATATSTGSPTGVVHPPGMRSRPPAAVVSSSASKSCKTKSSIQHTHPTRNRLQNGSVRGTDKDALVPFGSLATGCGHPNAADGNLSPLGHEDTATSLRREEQVARSLIERLSAPCGSVPGSSKSPMQPEHAPADEQIRQAGRDDQADASSLQMGRDIVDTCTCDPTWVQLDGLCISIPSNSSVAQGPSTSCPVHQLRPLDVSLDDDIQDDRPLSLLCPPTHAGRENGAADTGVGRVGRQAAILLGADPPVASSSGDTQEVPQHALVDLSSWPPRFVSWTSTDPGTDPGGDSGPPPLAVPDVAATTTALGEGQFSCGSPTDCLMGQRALQSRKNKKNKSKNRKRKGKSKKGRKQIHQVHGLSRAGERAQPTEVTRNELTMERDGTHPGTLWTHEQQAQSRLAKMQQEGLANAPVGSGLNETVPSAASALSGSHPVDAGPPPPEAQVMDTFLTTRATLEPEWLPEEDLARTKEIISDADAGLVQSDEALRCRQVETPGRAAHEQDRFHGEADGIAGDDSPSGQHAVNDKLLVSTMVQPSSPSSPVQDTSLNTSSNPTLEPGDSISVIYGFAPLQPDCNTHTSEAPRPQLASPLHLDMPAAQPPLHGAGDDPSGPRVRGPAGPVNPNGSPSQPTSRAIQTPSVYRRTKSLCDDEMPSRPLSLDRPLLRRTHSFPLAHALWEEPKLIAWPPRNSSHTSADQSLPSLGDGPLATLWEELVQNLDLSIPPLMYGGTHADIMDHSVVFAPVPPMRTMWTDQRPEVTLPPGWVPVPTAHYTHLVRFYAHRTVAMQRLVVPPAAGLVYLYPVPLLMAPLFARPATVTLPIGWAPVPQDAYHRLLAFYLDRVQDGGAHAAPGLANPPSQH